MVFSDVPSIEPQRALKGPRFLTQRRGPASSVRLSTQSIRVRDKNKTFTISKFVLLNYKQHILFNVSVELYKSVVNPNRARAQMLWRAPSKTSRALRCHGFREKQISLGELKEIQAGPVPEPNH